MDNKPVPDMSGRIMLLEQKMKGIHGRVSALEIRLSCGPAGDETDLIEFLPAEVPENDVSRISMLESRIKKLESSGIREKGPVKGKSLDFTGLIAGFLLILYGALLFFGSIDIMKNPMIPTLFGIVILAYVALKALRNDVR